MLTDSAFNALLKTLEEPPAHAIFILATTEPHKIPATILSRCMRLDFKLIPEEDLETHLKRILDGMGKEYEEEAVSAIARAGAGSDRDMLSIAEMCIAYEDKLTYRGVSEVLGAADFSETLALAEALLISDMPTALEGVERILSSGKSVGVLLKDLMAQLNRIAVAKTCRTAEKLLSLPKEQFAKLKAVADKADGRAVLRATEVLARAETDMRFVSSPRVCLETAVMRIALPEEDMSTDALLVRLNALERKLQEGAFAVPSPQAASGAQTAARETVAPTTAPPAGAPAAAAPVQASKFTAAPPAETPVQAPKSTTAPAAAAAGAGYEDKPPFPDRRARLRRGVLCRRTRTEKSRCTRSSVKVYCRPSGSSARSSGKARGCPSGRSCLAGRRRSGGHVRQVRAHAEKDEPQRRPVHDVFRPHARLRGRHARTLYGERHRRPLARPRGAPRRDGGSIRAGRRHRLRRALKGRRRAEGCECGGTAQTGFSRLPIEIK